MTFKKLRSIYLLIILVVFPNFIFSKPIFGKFKIKQLKTFVDSREVSMKIVFKVNVVGHIDHMKLKLAIPHNIKNRQKVKSLSYSLNPDSTYTVNSADYVFFRFENVDKSFKITMKCKMIIYNSINQSNQDLALDLSKYLIAEKDIETNSPKIMATAAKLKMNTDIETVFNTFHYVQDNIRYELKQDIGAEKVLESGVGKCMDFSDLMVALCRANGIPSKSIFGIVAEEDAENPLHAWSEVYLKKQGWVLFDPTTGHSEAGTSGRNFLLDVENKYIILAEGRNDPEFNALPYVINYFTENTGTIKIDTQFEIFSQ